MNEFSARSAFTLLELVVVLAILAVITTIATRSLDSVLEQNRFDAAQRSLRDIEIAVLGDPTERAPDGTRVVSGFVSDMGRLPRTREQSDGALSLRELWSPLTSPTASLPPFSVRPADEENLVAPAYKDSEVLVAAGWRGPYLRLPLGAEDALDGWGNRYDSPPTSDSTGYARLRDAGDNPLSTVGAEISIVRHLGGNGTRDVIEPDNNRTYDRDYEISFMNRVAAELKASVQLKGKDDSPPDPDTNRRIAVRIFSPDPEDAAKIQVVSAEITTDLTTVTLPASGTITGLAVGRRPVRAYLLGEDGKPSAKSAIKYIALQPGENFVEFNINLP